MSAANLDSITSNIAPRLSGETPGGLIDYVVRTYIFPIAGVVLFLILIAGGYQVMFSGGDPKALEAGKSKITNAIVGFFIVFAAYWIVQAVAIALGLKSINEIFSP